MDDKKEYHTFTEILHKHKIPYCMDSGVLLGLMREGKLLNHEKDIDLQMWSDNKEKIIEIVPELNALGWKVTIWRYKGLIYQFRIQRPSKIPIHIMLFRKYGEWAWCPAGRATGNPFSSVIGKKLYSAFIKIRRIIRNKLVITDVSQWPWKIRRDLGTWWVPAEFFEYTTYHERYKVYIPEKWDKYLEYRYGNWRFPVEDWDFWKQDGALKNKLPDLVVDISMYRESI